MELIKKGDLVKIEKLSDDVFNGEHPNKINKGYTQIGILHNNVIVGDCVYLGGLRTSPVTEIISNSIFKTRNSTYQMTKDLTDGRIEANSEVEEAERFMEEIGNLYIS